MEVRGIVGLPVGHPDNPGKTHAIGENIRHAMALTRLVRQEFTRRDFRDLLLLMNTVEWMATFKKSLITPEVALAGEKLKEALIDLHAGFKREGKYSSGPCYEALKASVFVLVEWLDTLPLAPVARAETQVKDFYARRSAQSA